jgi:hypothetical protein
MPTDHQWSVSFILVVCGTNRIAKDYEIKSIKIVN